MTADQQAAEERARSAAQAGRLHDRFAIDPNAPLAEFTTASAQAFATVDLLNPGRLLFALICEPDLPMRMVARERLGQASLQGLMQIIDHGVLDWPPRKRRCEAIVYPRPQGGAIGASYGHSGRTVPEHAISRWIAPPIAQALRALDSLAIAHRAIRLDNMFFIDKGHVELVLGDCTAGPAGFNQPVLYEPIERALASPSGRGEGSVTDDLYAFGVCLTILLIGDNPLQTLPMRRF